MNLTRLAVIAFVLLSSLARAEDWTVKGKTYKNVTVEKSDAEYVHIMFDGGIGRVALADLPADLQKKFNYDPKAAAAATQQEQAQLAASDAQVAAHSSNAAVVADATPLKLLGTVAGA